MPGILLWLSYYVLCAAGAVIVNVDMTSDAWPNAANCQTGESSSSGGTCNLRSAFELCLTVVGGEECSIELPVGADITMDSAFGPRMTVAAESNIRIKGNNATVSRIGVTELTSTELGGSFPLSTGSMTNTASATQNYKTACTEGCGGDVLSFTGCNYDNNQDTYYRLYSGTTQLALSDDYCGSVSYIQYSVADGAACAQYCLRAGCWSSATCSTTVQAFLTRYVPFNFIYYLQTAGGVSVPQLAIEDLTIHGFEGAVRLTGDIKLDLRRITFDRNQHDEGGAVYLDSNSQPVRMMDCVFTDGSALYGGSIYLEFAVTDITISDSVFTNNAASNYGGSIYVGDSCSNLIIRNCLFVDSSASVGGAIMLYWAVTNALIENCEFHNSAATSAGGAIYFYKYTTGLVIDNCLFSGSNSQSGGALLFNTNNDDVTVRNSAFQNNYASQNGGCIFVFTSNLRMTIDNSTFVDCVANVQAGGLFFNSRNEYIVIEKSTFTRCNSLTSSAGALLLQSENSHSIVRSVRFFDCEAYLEAGAMLLKYDNLRVLVTGSLFQNCVSLSHGGGMYVTDGNNYLVLENSTFDGCKAPYGWGGGVILDQASTYPSVRFSSFLNCEAKIGGGLVIYVGHLGAVVSDSAFTGCIASAGDGGGMNIYYGNNDALVLRSTFTDCSASSRGGGIAVGFSNYRMKVDSSTFTACSSYYGGGMQLEDDNTNCTIYSTAFHSCSSASNGGAIRIGTNQINFVVDGCVFKGCISAKGGALYVFRGNLFLIMRDTFITGSGILYQTSQGGAVSYWDLNDDTLFDNVTIEKSNGYRGGAIYLHTDNARFQIIGSAFSECASEYGGGAIMLNARNSQFSMKRSVVSRCFTVSGSGGAVELLEDNNDARLYLTSFDRNTAGDNGGALALITANLRAMIGGCVFEKNGALFSGGAMYLEARNSNAVVMDKRGFDNYRVLESSHPYESAMPTGGVAFVILSETVDGGANCSAWNLHFEETTETYFTDRFTIYDDSVNLNIIFSAGTDWPGTNLPSLRIARSSFYVEFVGPTSTQYAPASLSMNLYGFKLYCAPVYSDVNSYDKTIFRENTAPTRGGGIYILYNHLFPIVVNTEFNANTATAGSGGGLYLRTMNTGLVLDHVSVVGNMASVDGGGVALSMANVAIIFQSSTLKGNVAETGSGGGLSLTTGNGDGILNSGNEIMFRDTSFFDNLAVGGGGIYVGDDNAVMMDSCHFENNIALTNGGGGISLYKQSSMHVSSTIFESNRATICGGAIESVLSNYLTISDVDMNRNRANSTGGAVCLRGGSTVDLTGTTRLYQNSALMLGGGIALLDTPLWQLQSSSDQLIFEENSANRGSAAFFAAVTQGSDHSNIVYRNNNAIIGGTVYWLKSADMPAEPAGVNSNGAVWEGNEAGYGPMLATQAIQLHGPSAYDVFVYGDVLEPPIQLSMTDYYGQFVPSDSFSTVRISVDTATPLDCDGRNPYLSGEDLVGKGVVLKQGLAEFKHTQAFCAPNGSLGVEFTAMLGGLEVSENVAQSYYIRLKTKLHFRLCTQGEYIVDGECVVCPAGTYSLSDSVTKELTCVSCTDTEGIVACEGDQIVLEDGFWRRHYANTAVLTCPLAAGSCSGGNGTGDVLCSQGYEGALCAVCSDGYFPSQSECVECDSSSVMTPTLVIYICAIFTAVSIALLSAYYKWVYVDGDKDSGKLSTSRQSDSTVGGAVDAEEDQEPVSRLQLWILWFRMRYGQIMVKIKIVVVTLQVITAVPTIMSVSMPSNFSNFVDGFYFINLSFSDAFPLSCSGSFTFIDKLVLTTLAPIIVSILLCVLFFMEYSYHRRNIQSNKGRRRGEKAAAFNATKDKYLNYFFYLTYLVLPAVTTTIFQTFLCTNVDPDDEDRDDNDTYLTADMRISCQSDYYLNGVAYAVFMIFVYPIGVTAMYLALLYCNRVELRSRESEEMVNSDDSVKIASTALETPRSASNPLQRNPSACSDPVGSPPAAASDELSSSASRLSFLWEAYEPKFWYWEIIETTRRLTLTAVLSLVSPGSSEQAVASIMVSILFLKLYNEYKPYANDTDDELAEIGQYQVFFTFFGALILQNSLLSNSWNGVVGALLIMINFGVVLAACVSEVRTIKEEDGGDVSQAEKAFNRYSQTLNKSQSKGKSGPNEPRQEWNDANDVAATAPVLKRPNRRRSSISDREAARKYDAAVQKQKRRTPVVSRPSFSDTPVISHMHVKDKATADGSSQAIELASFPTRRGVRNTSTAGSRRTLPDSDDDDFAATSKTEEKKATETEADGASKAVAERSRVVSRATLTKRVRMGPDSDDDSEIDDDNSNAKNGPFRL